MASHEMLSTTPILEGTQRRLQFYLDKMGLEFTPDRRFVRWLASNRQHPRNWPMLRKIYDSGLIIWLDLFTYVRISCD